MSAWVKSSPTRSAAYAQGKIEGAMAVRIWGDRPYGSAPKRLVQPTDLSDDLSRAYWLGVARSTNA